MGFLDDALPAGKSVLNVAMLGPMVSMGHHRSAADQTIVAIGNNAVHEKLMLQLTSACFVHSTVIHPCAVVSPSAVLSEGSAVIAGASVGAEAPLGMGANDVPVIRSLLKDQVSGYQPSGEVGDWIHMALEREALANE